MSTTTTGQKQLVEAPQSDSTFEFSTLAYLEAYDAINNDDYAYVAYKETERAGGAWRIRIKARQTSGVVFEPEAMRVQARAAGAQGKPFFTWGAGMDPSSGDPRQVQFRVHVKDGKPSSIEIFVQLRKADHSAAEPVSATFAWPA